MTNERLKEIEASRSNERSLSIAKQDWLISRVRVLTEALEQYRGIAAHDCDKSTTKWSLADQVLNSTGLEPENECPDCHGKGCKNCEPEKF